MLTSARQKGITIWGLMVVAAVFIFFVLLFFKLLPPYLEYGKVRTSLENLVKQPNAGDLERAEIRAALERRFDIEDVKGVDLNKNLFVEKKPGATIIRVAYERRIPLAYNITALIDFEHSVQVGAR